LILALCIALGATRTPDSVLSSGLSRDVLRNVLRDRLALGLNLCPTCVEFTGEAIDELLNIILSQYINLFMFTLSTCIISLFVFTFSNSQ
jgi:hypothetical protein